MVTCVAQGGNWEGKRIHREKERGSLSVMESYLLEILTNEL